MALERIEYDDEVNMWHAQVWDKTGRYHQRWFNTESAARQWAASWMRR